MSTELVRFMSKSPNCLVAFEEIRKETKKGPVPWKMEKFKDNYLEINPEEDYGPKRGKGKGILGRLAQHPANRANGGVQFWEMDQNAVDVMQSIGGMVAREPSGGIDKKIDAQLEELYKKITGYDAEEHESIVQETCGMFDLFSIGGLPKPTPDYDALRVKGRLIEFFSILKEREIWEALEV